MTINMHVWTGSTEPATFSILLCWAFFRDSYFLYFISTEYLHSLCLNINQTFLPVILGICSMLQNPAKPYLKNLCYSNTIRRDWRRGHYYLKQKASINPGKNRTTANYIRKPKIIYILNCFCQIISFKYVLFDAYSYAGISHPFRTKEVDQSIWTD
jgi:hypothetical protein